MSSTQDQPPSPAAPSPTVDDGPPDRLGETPSERGNLSDLLQELRVLLQGVQVLTGFLIVLPFYQAFATIALLEKWVYLATFACSVSGLILFSAPAAQHRLEWPLRDRARFKVFATHMIIIGLVPFSLALVLATQLVVSQILGAGPAFAVAGIAALLIGAVWWLVPLVVRQGR
jgi:hypothetical protein